MGRDFFTAILHKILLTSKTAIPNISFAERAIWSFPCIRCKHHRTVATHESMPAVLEFVLIVRVLLGIAPVADSHGGTIDMEKEPCSNLKSLRSSLQ